ncbi:MAG TPA: hypothetical protein VFP37_03020 [Steroidobacteraceae bacterium]|nr:hypothetical protein [Steroidobacteraceae bacterium]
MGVRTSGILKVIGGGVLVVIICLTVLKGGLGDPAHGGPFKLIVLGVPGAIALAGLIELVTGTQFQKVAGAWDELAGWQRGVLGTLIVTVAFLLMIAGVVAFA